MKSFGTTRLGITALLALALSSPLSAADNDISLPVERIAPEPTLLVNLPVARPRMSPELALARYESYSRWQSQQLGETDDTTTITADLPNAGKHGQYRLKRIYSAPRQLAFKALGFVGDGFVKANVITRLLQSEADHVRKDQPGDTAVTRQNYKFSFKGTEVVNGRTAHVFQVKPRQKRPSLFKGKVYIDAYSGGLVRVEGRVAKSPSFFIKNIDFVQDYAQVGDFNLVTHIHSVADTRIIGKAIVDISHDDYQVRSLEQLQAVSKSAVVAPLETKLGF